MKFVLKHDRRRSVGVMVSMSDFPQEDWRVWFEAKLAQALLCCFLKQENVLYVLSLYPEV